jgi:integrase/recombinase XerD
MTPRRQHMLAALQLSGTSERTQLSYVREVRLLAQFYRQSPALISEPHLQHSVLHRKNVDGLLPRSMRLCYSALRFFSQQVLERHWQPLARMRAQTEQRLPAVRSLQEVHRLLQAMTPLHNRVYCTTLYSGGLRLNEALSLQVGDIDGSRPMLHVHRGKGAKDRSIPLPDDTLDLLRTSWKTPRHRTWLFPAPGRDHKHMASATSPMPRSSLQGAFRTAKHRADICQRDVGPHPLRHSYATHLLAAGVNLRAMQRYMGQAQLETTLISRHLPPKGQEDAVPRLHEVRRGLASCFLFPTSSPPTLQSILSALPSCRPRTTRPWTPSATAAPAPLALASLPAAVVAHNITSLMPVASGTGRRVSLIKRHRGGTANSINSCLGRTS